MLTLKIEDLPSKEPGKGEVRLKVEAIGLNRAESMVSMDSTWRSLNCQRASDSSSLAADFGGVTGKLKVIPGGVRIFRSPYSHPCERTEKTSKARSNSSRWEFRDSPTLANSSMDKRHVSLMTASWHCDLYRTSVLDDAVGAGLNRQVERCPSAPAPATSTASATSAARNHEFYGDQQHQARPETSAFARAKSQDQETAKGAPS